MNAYDYSRRKRLERAIKRLPGLVAYYPLNETSGDAKNYAPATKGSLDGSVTGATQGGVGQLGRACSFDGVNDNIDIGDIAAINDATSLSIFVLAKFNNTTQDHYIFGNSAGASSGFIFIADDAGFDTGRTNTFKIVVQESGTGTIVAKEYSTDANTADIWEALMFTFAPDAVGGLKLYINGIEDSQSPTNTSSVVNVGNSNAGLRIGESPGGGFDANASYQHFVALNRALSATEARLIAHKGGFI